jgi:mRNA deadenylase 3'-5' endonuclease subunit Ccr4
MNNQNSTLNPNQNNYQNKSQSNNYNNNTNLKMKYEKKPPTRKWIPEINKNPKYNYIRVMSYNILCDSLASISTNIKESEFINFPHLNWEIRRKKILDEINLHLPDILCLQELERDEILLNSLGEIGYDVI